MFVKLFLLNAVYKIVNRIPCNQICSFKQKSNSFLFCNLKYTSNTYLNKEKVFRYLTGP